MKAIISALFISVTTLGSAHAGLIPASIILESGSFSNSSSLIVDGFTPAESSGWNTSSNVYWNGTSTFFDLDFGGLYTLDDAMLSVDNNDNYDVLVSVDGSSWSTLFQVDASFGDIAVSPGGMDTMSSILGDAEYVGGIDFSQTLARYARVLAVSGDDSYALGELAFYGDAYSAQGPTPASAPSGLFLLLGGIGFMVAKRRIAKC